MSRTRNLNVVPQALPPPPGAGIVRRFLVWAQRADALERAEAASALARAYLHADLAGALRAECLFALTALLDDPHVAVRRALSEAFASARAAPRALVVALANDASEIAAPLLARSPLLTDAELVDCVAVGDTLAQCEIARRPGLGAAPAGALSEVGTREAARALIGNWEAQLTPGALRRLLERFGDDIDIRAALVARADLPANLEAEIAIATAGALRGPAEGLASRRATRDAALAAIAARCPEDELPELVRTLCARSALTMALLLRSLAGGERALFAAALAELSGLSIARAAGLIRDPRGAGFAAAALKAGLQRHALPAFRAALEAIATRGAGEGQGLKTELIGAVIGDCEAEGDPALAPFLAFLWRLAAEAARADARAAIAGQVLPPSLDFAPSNDDDVTGRASIPPQGQPLSNSSEDAAPPVELPADLVLALDAAPSVSVEDADPRFELPAAVVLALEAALLDCAEDAAPPVELPADLVLALEAA